MKLISVLEKILWMMLVALCGYLVFIADKPKQVVKPEHITICSPADETDVYCTTWSYEEWESLSE